MSQKPAVLLATTPNCPHCPGMKKILQQLEQRQLLAELQIIDITQNPQLAEQYQIRSVPWLRIAELEFTGAYPQGELEYWVTHANTDVGIRQYLSHALENGRLADINKQIHMHPEWLVIAVSLLADMQAPMQARIGLSALIEGLEDQALLSSILPMLQQYARHDDARVRGDACHLLGCIHSEAATQTLRQCLHDPDPQVREIAEESLASLQ